MKDVTSYSIMSCSLPRRHRLAFNKLQWSPVDSIWIQCMVGSWPIGLAGCRYEATSECGGCLSR
jgi:hypothetical protein